MPCRVKIDTIIIIIIIIIIMFLYVRFFKPHKSLLSPKKQQIYCVRDFCWRTGTNSHSQYHDGMITQSTSLQMVYCRAYKQKYNYSENMPTAGPGDRTENLSLCRRERYLCAATVLLRISGSWSENGKHLRNAAGSIFAGSII